MSPETLSIQVMPWILLISTFLDSVIGQKYPAYSSSSRHCTSNSQCLDSIGEICWWRYSGCTRGECMCDPRSHFLDSSGKCRKVKFGWQSCTSRDVCPARMSCRDGHCACPAERGMTMTDDARYCLRPRERVLGQPCNQARDLCLQSTVAGYTREMVSCYLGRCRCSRGYKQSGNRCRRLLIGEGICSRDHHCQGGALCLNRKCQCPQGYVAVSGNSKCAKRGAQYGVDLGSQCNEVQEHRYCSRGLVCHQCPSDRYHTCVRYRESHAYSRARLPEANTTAIILSVSGVMLTILLLLFSSS